MAPMYTPYETAIPGADIYAQADTLATNAYNKALAQINANRLNTLTSYGYKGTVDPHTGVVSNIVVDPTNPYGKLQELFHTQASEDRDATFQAEDRGLRGGLAHQAASELRYQHGAQRTGLGSDLSQALSGYQDQQDEAAYTRDAALWQAQLEQLQAAIAAGAFNPPDDGGDGPGGTPPGGSDGLVGASVGTPGYSSGVGYQQTPRGSTTFRTDDGSGGDLVSNAKKKALKRIIYGGGGAGRTLHA